jgi:hypothetical protein
MAIDHLRAKYGVPEDHIQLFEGGTMELEYTGESFWYAKYIIGLDGKPETGGTEPGSDGTRSTPPEPKPAILPAPDTTRPAILPMPPDEPSRDEKVVYGGVYIRLKTGQVLDMEEAQDYFIAERETAVREWERLRAEAGKLDVSLYLKLKSLPSGEKVTVWLYPAHVITDGIRAQFAALKQKYPGMGEGLDLDALFMTCAQGYIARDLIACDDGSCAMPELTIETRPAIGGGDGATSGGGASDPGGSVKPAIWEGKPEPDVLRPDVQPDDEYWRAYNVFWAAVEEIRLQAVAQSISEIRAALERMGVTYREESACVVADLTAGQIQEIAELKAVAGVCEETLFTTMVDASLMIRGGGDAGERTAPPTAETKNAAAAIASAANSPAGYATAVLLIGALMALGLSAVKGRGRP